MAELARMKQAGRIEVLRERTANIHVFVFIDGTRPSDELVTASLEEVGPGPAETKEAVKEPARAKRKSLPRKTNRAKASPKRKRR